MDYEQLVDVYERLEQTTKKLEKRDILANFYSKVPKDELNTVVLLSMGVISKKGEDLGIAFKMMKKIIAKVAGVSASEVEKTLKKTGDIGLTGEILLKKKRQKMLGRKKLSTEKVMSNLRKLIQISGAGSQERKIALVSELLANAEPREALYIIRNILGQMRTGVAEGIVRDALAKAFNQEPEEIEHAYNLLGNYGLVAELAKKRNLSKIELVVGRPVRVMLAQKAPNLETALKKFAHPALEVKIDGFRTQIHKKGNEIKIFSRRMDDVTHQFPELVEWARKYIRANSCIIEGETVAIDPKTGKPLKFQKLSRRIQRKYNIDKMVKEIPIQINLFDLLFVNHKNYMNKPLKERWSKLKSIIEQKRGKIVLVEHIETKDIKRAKEFYQKSLATGEEGIMIKNLDAHYKPGKRVGYWLKVKPTMEPLDLVIIEAEWGKGKRAGWLSSFTLGARMGNKFVPVGKMGTGLTDRQFKDLTKKLKALIIDEHNGVAKIKPSVVVEVQYEEIQKSPNYSSGYALRFPRLLRIRDPTDKGPEEADDIKRIKRLYKQQ
ncbi:MAG: ATP-dependent DNA ligase [Candidatus Aenigmarchaeota archaeon]|nr:ATP-dependent DNA ligase [Candidatus Aenigmarchaeota archaeon]